MLAILDTISVEVSESETVLVMPAILDTASDEVRVSERDCVGTACVPVTASEEVSDSESD